MPVHIRGWKCDCGAVHDWDMNAAVNIQRQGIIELKVVTACGGLRKPRDERVAA